MSATADSTAKENERDEDDGSETFADAVFGGVSEKNSGREPGMVFHTFNPDPSSPLEFSTKTNMDSVASTVSSDESKKLGMAVDLSLDLSPRRDEAAGACLLSRHILFFLRLSSVDGCRCCPVARR